MIATSESGRRNAARCARIVGSAGPAAVTIVGVVRHQRRRLRIDQETVPGLERRLVTAALLSRRVHHVAEVADQLLRVGGAAWIVAGAPHRRVRIPGQEALVVPVVQRHRPQAGGTISWPLSSLGVAPGVQASPLPMSPMLEVMMPMWMSCTAVNSGALPAWQARLPCCSRRLAGRRIDAHRRDQAVHEHRHGVAQDALLVRHRDRVIDHEEEVDLVDGGLRDLTDEHVARGRRAA